MTKNLYGKMAKVETPHHTFTAGDFEYRVLKCYQGPEKEKSNPYARWFVAVSSPLTWGRWEYGDIYVDDIPGAIRGRRW